MLQAQTYAYDKHVLAVLGTPILCFLFSPSSSLVSCELFVTMRLIHQKQVYHSLCRCLIPPLYTMFMPATSCRVKYFGWMLQVVTLCCPMPLPPYAMTVPHFTLYCFMQHIIFDTIFHNLQYYITCAYWLPWPPCFITHYKKTTDLEPSWAPDGLGQDLAADPPAGNVPQKLQKKLIWNTFGLRTALARIWRLIPGPNMCSKGDLTCKEKQPHLICL